MGKRETSNGKRTKMKMGERSPKKERKWVRAERRKGEVRERKSEKKLS